MAGVDDELPRMTPDVVAWLGEYDAMTARIDGIRSWHGEAALVAALEQVAGLPVALRGPAFFERIRDMKRVRKDWGGWPTMKSEDWGKG